MQNDNDTSTAYLDDVEGVEAVCQKVDKYLQDLVFIYGGTWHINKEIDSDGPNFAFHHS